MAHIYFIEFKHKKTGEHFYKVGFTTSSFDERFLLDLDRFDVKLIVRSPEYSWKQAMYLEQHYHSILRPWSYQPKAFLISGGSTECYLPVKDVYRRMVQTPTKENPELTMNLPKVKSKKFDYPKVHEIGIANGRRYFTQDSARSNHSDSKPIPASYQYKRKKQLSRERRLKPWEEPMDVRARLADDLKNKKISQDYYNQVIAILDQRDLKDID